MDSFPIKSLSQDFSVLYVEDETTIRGQLVPILRRYFKEVYEADSGGEGLELYRHHRPELVITDLKMPGMDGLEMLRRIRQEDEDQQVIILSAHHELEYLSKAIESGVDAFLLKPVQADQLFPAIKKSLEGVRTRMENRRYQEMMESTALSRTFELEKKSVTDELTGLNNSIYLNQRVASGKHTVLLIDIDHFGLINSSYGFDFGDTILKSFARLLSQHTPEEATLFRLSGDEFVLLFPGNALESARKEGRRLQKIISNHAFYADIIDFNLTCSIGLAAGEGNTTLINAHEAMRKARKLGPGRLGVHNPDIVASDLHRQNLLYTRRLKQAFRDDRIIPVYQPMIDMATKQVVKYECLARILAEDGSLVSPAFFLPQAYLIGALPEITRIMIEKSFQAFSKKTMSFSINITEEDLQDAYLPTYFSKQLERHAIDPEQVTLEVLENISAEGSTQAFNQLTELKQMGFRIALDDFGSDKSNFHRLLEMDVDYIKIDGLYIKHIHENPKSSNIVRTITQFAHNIGAEVIAEYVHNEAVAKEVERLEIDYSQGYYYGAPSPTLDA